MAHQAHDDEEFPKELAIIIIGGLLVALLAALVLQ